MFSLTVTDHLRLEAEQAAQNYTIHAREADRLVRFAFGARVLTATLLALSTALQIATLVAPGRAIDAVASAASAAALLVFALYSVTGLESRVTAHRAFAHRLWMVSQRFRALVAEIDDGLVERDAQLRRRDELLSDLHDIYGQGFGVDQRAHEHARIVPPAASAA